jgi:hypothetical protein
MLSEYHHGGSLISSVHLDFHLDEDGDFGMARHTMAVAMDTTNLTTTAKEIADREIGLWKMTSAPSLLDPSIISG